MTFFQSPIFNPAFKTKVHILQLIMVIAVMGLSGAKIVTRPSYVPMSRMDMIGMSMGGKTLIIIGYQLATEHISRLRRWGSLRANAILNTVEVILWPVVIGITFFGISKVCIGISCVFGWLIALVAFLMTLACFWAAVVCWGEFRRAKNGEADSELAKLRGYNV